MNQHSWSDIFLDTSLACDRDEARKEAVRELIATAVSRFERDTPHSAADVFENIAAILRSKL